MNKRYLLIDGHNLLFRMFFGMPDEFYTSGRVKFNAVYGFASALSKVISMIRPSHVFVAFDSPDCGERRMMDASYKANRPSYAEAEPDMNPFSQLPAIYSLLEEMSVPYREIHGCEADDVISSYAKKLEVSGDVIIMSTDRDYWQLIGEHVSVLNYRGYDSTLVTPHTVELKFGIKPGQFADFKCLVGDKSDNIVGVAGIGNKRAAELLTQYGSIEGIYENIDKIERASTRAALEESHERLELNRRLICLTGDAPLPMEENELLYHKKAYSDLYDLSYRCAEEASQDTAGQE